MLAGYTQNNLMINEKGMSMSDENASMNWQQFWEQTRDMFDKGEIPGGEFYQQLHAQATTRGVTYEEFYYLLSRYPALIIRNVESPDLPNMREAEVIKSTSGWDIIDCDGWLLSSPGKLLWGAYREGADEASAEKKGVGTLTQQAVDTAYDMIILAQEKGWPSAHVVHGFYGMIRAAWIAAESLSFNLEGFTPTINDQVVQSWVAQILDDKKKIVQQKKKDIAERAKRLKPRVNPLVG